MASSPELCAHLWAPTIVSRIASRRRSTRFAGLLAFQPMLRGTVAVRQCGRQINESSIEIVSRVSLAFAQGLLFWRRRRLGVVMRRLLRRWHDRFCHLRHDGGLVRFVVWSRAQLIARDIQGRDELLAFGLEAEIGLGYGYLARADPQEAAELDHRRHHATAGVGEQIDDPADVLFVAAANLDAKDTSDVLQLSACLGATALTHIVFIDGVACAGLRRCRSCF